MPMKRTFRNATLINYFCVIHFIILLIYIESTFDFAVSILFILSLVETHLVKSVYIWELQTNH